VGGAIAPPQHAARLMLQARSLTKRYGGLLALDRVSFELHPGEIVGYLGPNGSGKSTTVNIVVGLLEPTLGSVSLRGVLASDDPVAYKRRIGYVPEEPSLYAHLTAFEYLMLVGRLRRLPAPTLDARIRALLQLLQLHDSRYKSMTAFSKGMRQRVLIAAALLHNPDLLVLDEPFSGLDVNAGLLLRTLLRLLAREGRMIFFSTHRFDMVEKLCSRVIVLSAGRIVLERRVADFEREGPGSLEETFARVTHQHDYEPIARSIFDAIAAG
jgi:ABC-2 type transport system ATP-binding protein